MIKFQQDIKYQLIERTEWPLIEPIVINHSYATQWYGIDKEKRIVWAEAWCAWDGATLFPDFDWILESSLRHDVLLWLVAAGAIPESMNHMIDKELARYIQLLGGPLVRGRVADTLLKVRSGYVRRATNLANTMKGEVRPVYKLEYGKREVLR